MTWHYRNWHRLWASVSIASIIGLSAIFWGLLSFDQFGLDFGREESALRGFYMAAEVISIAWWCNWKHYIRYWLQNPPYNRRTILVMRGMLFVWMAAAIATLISYIFIYDWRSFNIVVPLIIAVKTLLSFGILDGFLRFWKGPPDDADWENGEIKWSKLVS